VELVLHVLRHADMQQRLGPCSLVCRAWRAAAVSVTDSISVEIDCWKQTGRIRSAAEWLRKHGAALKHITLLNTSVEPVLLQLPFAELKQLCSLSLQGCELQDQQEDSQNGCSKATTQPRQEQDTADDHASSSSSSSSHSTQLSLFGLTNLTALDLSNVTWSLNVGLNAVSTLTGLRQLRLSTVTEDMPAGVTWEDRLIDAAQDIHDCYFDPNSLSSLTLLTQLELSPDLMPDTTEEGPLGCLKQLQALAFWGSEDAVTDRLMPQWLPPTLTKLQMYCVCECECEPLNSSYAPALSAATALQHLDLHAREDGYGGIEPDFLSSMQQLRVLSLRGPFSKNGLPVLVEALPVLTRLESLIISAEYNEDAVYGRPVYGCLVGLGDEDMGRYAALLPPSQHLTRFELTWPFDGPSLLPPGCMQHMFAAGRRLPQLKHLVLGMASTSWGSADVWQKYEYEGCDMELSGMPACFGADDLAHLVSCCPALEELCIAGLVQPGVDMGSLTALTALTGLCIGGDAIDDGVASSVLTQLRGLQSLEVYFSYHLTDAGLLALTTLTQLTMLHTAGCGTSYDVAKPVELFAD
jgi:hypothetical protein